MVESDRGAPRYWAVIPAAGVGRRMGSELPKQYLPLAGKTVIEHALAPFLAEPLIAGVMVGLSGDDEHWPQLQLQQHHPRLHRSPGGAERFHTVVLALKALRTVGAGEADWVLVHDAARPCLSRDDLKRLLTTLAEDRVGGLLAAPVVDTLKRCRRGDDGSWRVETTVDRTPLWRALTPQMFRLAPLLGALERAIERGERVTDDASAMELAGVSPRVVAGDGENLKLTHRADLLLAERILIERQSYREDV
ncbi:MAG: 2-C-methyl-D-erythritol 4-phosphate cytidylyltransferase [Gammaproteobacteria bacterium]|nr:2-C-methyl-D-erythritol 4-phosphate cytidylyltransferase [Gammaproteobacteria bacterium]